MALRSRILSDPETVQDFALASDEKYWEGIELLMSGKRGAGIYLLGYAIEMLLKNACFLTDGAKPFDPVRPRLGPIKSWAKLQIPGIPHESYHSLWFWIAVLRSKRALSGRQLQHQFDRKLVRRVHRIYGIWVVDMRYKPDQALENEAELMYNDVTWIRDRKNRLVV